MRLLGNITDVCIYVKNLHSFMVPQVIETENMKLLRNEIHRQAILIMLELHHILYL